MIVPMSQVFVVARAGDRRKLLDALGALGVVHLTPVDPTGAKADEKTVASIDRLGRAVQVLSEVRPAGAVPDLAPAAAAAEALDLQRAQAERRGRLTRLHRQYEHLELWGDVRLKQLSELAAAGVRLRLVSVPVKEVDGLQGECMQVVRPLRGSSVLVVLVDRGEQAPLPEGAMELPVPTTDRPSLRAEAARIDDELRAAGRRLAELANLVPAMQEARRSLKVKAAFTIADRGGLAGDALYAVQGWVPSDQAEGLARGLADQRVAAAVTSTPAGPEDSPPTLIRAPRWAKPAEGLLKALGTVPGYREPDVSVAFMIALPIFAAILISDACYSLLFLVIPAIFYRRLVAKMSRELTHLVILFGVTGLIWGVVTGSYFGVGPEQMVEAGGVWAPIGKVLGYPKLFPVDISERSQDILKRISFLLAAIHLSTAHLWRAVTRFPNIRFLSSLGWAAALWGVYGLVKRLVLSDPFLGTAYPILMYGGFALAVAFATPRKYVIDGILLGALSSVFPAIATLSDTISYVRLMAIGLAGSVLAARFNAMAMDSGSILMAVPILALGHFMNGALLLIALVAHGVRLNILEFSNNLGMEWTGYAYAPFAHRTEEN
ncbi:MAG: hypothetical protein MUP47_00260 [Phycisphaerae bacterium]|nr:hypothetical protein [Phycisphaerae bacterium]